MRAALTAALAGGLALTAAAPALAQTAADKADARCILVLNLAGKDPKNREKAAQGVFFYLGRITGRGPTSRLAALLDGESKAITTGQQAQAELNRCGQQLNASGAALGAAFQTLVPRGAPPPQASPATPAIPNPFVAPPK